MKKLVLPLVIVGLVAGLLVARAQIGPLLSPKASPTATQTPVSAAKPPGPTPTPRRSSTPVPTVALRADIAYILDGDVWVSDVETAQSRRLTSDGGYSWPRFAPDGQTLLVVHGTGSASEILTLRLDGTKGKLLTNDTVAQEKPVWSPRGDKIAYTVTRDTDRDGQIGLTDAREVWIMDASGANPHKIADGYEPAWSPDGARLAFATNGTLRSQNPVGPSQNAIHLINAQGKNEWSLLGVETVASFDFNKYKFPFSPSPFRVRSPAWSPDGKVIAFAADGHTGLIGTISDRADGLAFWALNYEGGVGGVAWAPRGSRIAYESRPASGINHVVIQDIPFGTKVNIGDERTGVSAGGLAWSPDGKRLAMVQRPAPRSNGQDSGWHIVVTASDGGDRKIVSQPGQVLDPDWNPR